MFTGSVSAQFFQNPVCGLEPGLCSRLMLLPSLHRNKDTTRDEFIFYSKRLMRLLIEHALSFLPLKVSSHSLGVATATSPLLSLGPRKCLVSSTLLPFLQSVTVETPQGTMYEGKRFHRQRVRCGPVPFLPTSTTAPAWHRLGKPGGSRVHLCADNLSMGPVAPALVPQELTRTQCQAVPFSSLPRSQVCPSCAQGRPWSRPSLLSARTSAWARSSSRPTTTRVSPR